MKLFLVEERERLGLKAKDIAEYAEIAVPTQSNYENGKRFPDAKYLLKISELGFDLTYVLTGQRPIFYSDTKTQMLIELFKKLPEEKQNQVLADLLTNNSSSNSGGATISGDNSGNVVGRDQIF